MFRLFAHWIWLLYRTRIPARTSPKKHRGSCSAQVASPIDGARSDHPRDSPCRRLLTPRCVPPPTFAAPNDVRLSPGLRRARARSSPNREGAIHDGNDRVALGARSGGAGRSSGRPPASPRPRTVVRRAIHPRAHPGSTPRPSDRRVVDPPSHHRALRGFSCLQTPFFLGLADGKKYPPLLASQAYWRIAGMSYLKYSNMCGEVVRASLKEPFFSQAKAREAVYMKASKFVGGKAQAPVITEVIPPSAGK